MRQLASFASVRVERSGVASGPVVRIPLEAAGVTSERMPRSRILNQKDIHLNYVYLLKRVQAQIHWTKGVAYNPPISKLELHIQDLINHNIPYELFSHRHFYTTLCTWKPSVTALMCPRVGSGGRRGGWDGRAGWTGRREGGAGRSATPTADPRTCQSSPLCKDVSVMDLDPQISKGRKNIYIFTIFLWMFYLTLEVKKHNKNINKLLTTY